MTLSKLIRYYKTVATSILARERETDRQTDRHTDTERERVTD